ncbi:MAG TPA: PAS domain-containing protein [Candidatus Acidoferrum sp.]|nr:PAS domain-containing protein [Candidatus Acidoferrum sp.]
METRRSALDRVAQLALSSYGLIALAAGLGGGGLGLRLAGHAAASTAVLCFGIGAIAAAVVSSWHIRRERLRAGVSTRREVAREQALFRDELDQRLDVQRKLREREAALRTIIESAPIALFAIDRHGVITISAGVGPDPLGKKAGEAVGWPAADLLADHPGVLKKVREALSGSRGEVDLRQGDRTFSLSLSPFRHANGTTAGAIVVAVDVTERRHAAEALQQTVDELRRVDGDRRALLTRLVHAQEEERRQIASDIHDDSIQALFAVSVRLLALRAGLHDAAQIAVVDQLQKSVREASERLRHLLFELRPAALDEGGLPAAIREYLETLKADSGLTVSLTTSLEDSPASEVEVIAYRIAQEALTNVRKHARARHIDCTVSSDDGGILTRITDDGVGFDSTRSTAQPGHLGTVAMRERAEMAGGWLRITSAVGKGCVVEFWIPNAKERVANAA